MMSIRVLVVEDDSELREALVDTLELSGMSVSEAEHGEAACEALARASFDIVITDVNMPGMDGHALLGVIRQKYPMLPVLLMTAFGQVSKAVDAIRSGAADYLMKPFEPDVLIAAVERFARGEVAEQQAPVASDERSVQLLELARRVAATDSTVLIAGESGTGKEVLARYIHNHSSRAEQPFIAINCAAIPENMLEAMLFGHEKGAFTGAIASQPGKFEQANGGTLLLDEVTEMDLGLQAKLLRVLQEQEVERVGGKAPIKLDVRVLATTNRELRQYVSEGAFREDLYYRLNVFPLHWSPLRERPGDIVPLSEAILQRLCAKMQRPVVVLSDTAKTKLTDHTWPGNVRELDNVLQRALILQTGPEIYAEDLFIEEGNMTPRMEPAVTSADVDEKAAGALENDLREHEFQLIIDALKETGGSRKEAAEKLAISPRTLRYKLAKIREAGLDLDALLKR